MMEAQLLQNGEYAGIQAQIQPLLTTKPKMAPLQVILPLELQIWNLEQPIMSGHMPPAAQFLLVITSIILFILSGCKKENDSEDSILPIDEVQETRKKLIGIWVELSPCDSCRLFEFTEQDSIIQTFIRLDRRHFYYFQITAPDSIKVLRDWKIDEYRKETTHKLLFHSDDTLTLKQFLAVDYGTGFETIKLYKTK